MRCSRGLRSGAPTPPPFQAADTEVKVLNSSHGREVTTTTSRAAVEVDCGIHPPAFRLTIIKPVFVQAGMPAAGAVR